MTVFNAIGDCIEKRKPIPLDLAVQMTPDALELDWANSSSARREFAYVGLLSIRNYVLFNVRPHYFARSVLRLMGKNIDGLKADLDVRTWKPLRDGLDATEAVLAGDLPPTVLNAFAAELRTLNREPWNSSWIIFALGTAVNAIEHGYDSELGITLLMHALRVGIQGKMIAGRPFEEEIVRLFERFLARVGPPTAAEIVAAAIRHSEESP